MFLLIRVFNKLLRRYGAINKIFIKKFTYYIYIYFFRKFYQDNTLTFDIFVEEQKERYFEILADMYNIKTAKIFNKVFLNICNRIKL